MKIRDMKLFLEIVRAGSISIAAQNLYISQPSLSQSIKKMEKEIGADLFIRRTGRVIELTRSGEQFAEMAAKVVELYENYLEHMDTSLNQAPQTLRIGVPYHQGHLVMDALLHQADALKDRFELTFSEAQSDVLEESLIDRKIDIACIRLPLLISNLKYRIIKRDPIGIYLYPGHPAIPSAVSKEGAPYKYLPIDAIKNDILVLPPPGKRMRHTIDSIFKSYNFIPKSIEHHESKKSMLSMVNNCRRCTLGTPLPDQPDAPFYLIEGCDIYYDLAMVYMPDTLPKKILDQIDSILINALNHA